MDTLEQAKMASPIQPETSAQNFPDAAGTDSKDSSACRECSKIIKTHSMKRHLTAVHSYDTHQLEKLKKLKLKNPVTCFFCGISCGRIEDHLKGPAHELLSTHENYKRGVELATLDPEGYLFHFKEYLANPYSGIMMRKQSEINRTVRQAELVIRGLLGKNGVINTTDSFLDGFKYLLGKYNSKSELIKDGVLNTMPKITKPSTKKQYLMAVQQFIWALYTKRFISKDAKDLCHRNLSQLNKILERKITENAGKSLHEKYEIIPTLEELGLLVYGPMYDETKGILSNTDIEDLSAESVTRIKNLAIVTVMISGRLRPNELRELVFSKYGVTHVLLDHYKTAQKYGLCAVYIPDCIRKHMEVVIAKRDTVNDYLFQNEKGEQIKNDGSLGSIIQSVAQENNIPRDRYKEWTSSVIRTAVCTWAEDDPDTAVMGRHSRKTRQTFYDCTPVKTVETMKKAQKAGSTSELQEAIDKVERTGAEWLQVLQSTTDSAETEPFETMETSEGIIIGPFYGESDTTEQKTDINPAQEEEEPGTSDKTRQFNFTGRT